MLIKFRHTTMASLKDKYWYDGSGHYYIRTKEELKAFRDILNGNVTKVGGISKKTVKSYYFSGETVELCNDIDLEEEEWEPIGTKYSFVGTFEGNNHEIKNLKINRSDSIGINVGFFARVGGTVKNLTVSGNINYKCETSNGVANYGSSSSYRHEEGTGGIVGYLAGSIQNCVNKVNITDNRPLSAVGGIVGLVCYDGATVKNCTNFGKIDGCSTQTAGNCPSSVGGIAGLSRCKSTIQESINHGEITEHSTANSVFCGGILGCAWAQGDLTKIERCKNTGYIHNTIGHSIAGYGGIAGGLRRSNLSNVTSPYTYLTIKNSYNTGYVYGSRNAGGILGAVYGGYINTSSQIGYSSATVINCYNIGKIEGELCIGGIVGDNASSAYDDTSYESLEVTDCFSLGEIVSGNPSSTGSDGTIYYYGNLIGYVPSGTTKLYYSYCSASFCDRTLGRVVYIDSSYGSFQMNGYNYGFVEDLESYVKDITKLASKTAFSTCTNEYSSSTFDAKWDSSWSSSYWMVDETKNNGFPILQFETA